MSALRPPRRSVRVALGLALLMLTATIAPTVAAVRPASAQPLTPSAIVIGTGSCVGVDACTDATGPIGDYSCNGDLACYKATGSIGDNSCDDNVACSEATGPIGDASCNGFTACNGTTAPIGDYSCTGSFACATETAPIGDCQFNDVQLAACEAKPDFRIRKPGGVLVGNNIYNTTGASQSVTGSNAPGTTRQFILTIQNDGLLPDAFQIFTYGSYGTNSFTVTYKRLWQPAVDITSEVSGITLTTPTLAPGEIYYFRVYIHVPPTDTAGDFYGTYLAIWSLADKSKQDAVRFRVNVT